MDLASLRAQQLELASSVIREDRLRSDPPDLIGGADAILACWWMSRRLAWRKNGCAASLSRSPPNPER